MNLLNDQNTYIPTSLNNINKNIEIYIYVSLLSSNADRTDSLRHPLLMSGILDCIQFLHTADFCKYLLDGQ